MIIGSRDFISALKFIKSNIKFVGPLITECQYKIGLDVKHLAK